MVLAWALTGDALGPEISTKGRQAAVTLRPGPLASSPMYAVFMLIVEDRARRPPPITS